MDLIKEMGEWLIVMMSSLFVYLFGEFDVAIQVMIVFMFIDYISGLMAAKAEKNWSSEICIKDIYKKAGMLLCIVIANMGDKVTGTEAIRTVIILFFIGNEGISILENMTRVGVPISPKLTETLLQLRGKGDGKSEDNK